LLSLQRRLSTRDVNWRTNLSCNQRVCKHLCSRSTSGPCQDCAQHWLITAHAALHPAASQGRHCVVPLLCCGLCAGLWPALQLQLLNPVRLQWCSKPNAKHMCCTCAAVEQHHPGHRRSTSCTDIASTLLIGCCASPCWRCGEAPSRCCRVSDAHSFGVVGVVRRCSDNVQRLHMPLTATKSASCHAIACFGILRCTPAAHGTLGHLVQLSPERAAGKSEGLVALLNLTRSLCWVGFISAAQERAGNGRGLLLCVAFALCLCFRPHDGP
jgi:hypothetical protein